MPNNNKNGRMFRIVMYLVGILVTILITAVMFTGKNVIANDKDSRARDLCVGQESRDRDAKIKEDFQKEVKEINESQHKIEKLLVAIQVKMGIPIE